MKSLLIKLLRKIAVISHHIDSAVNSVCFKLVCKLDDGTVIFRDCNIED